MTLIDEYKTYLENEDLSALTVIGYVADTRLFMEWFKKNNREEFALEKVTPSDVREYRSYLQNGQGFKATTANWRRSPP
jgi:integrase/recombinase XerC